MDEKVRKITDWIETNMGDRIVKICVRGDRNEDFPPEPLECEVTVINVLRDAGLPAPEIYGICPDPHAIVMEAVPGRHNLATAESEEERVSVLKHLGGSCHLWMAPALQGVNWFDDLICRGAVICPACLRGAMTAGPDGFRWPGPTQSSELEAPTALG